MRSGEAMRKKISTATDLYSVVRMMKAVAGANVRQQERAVESLASYAHTLEMGFQILLRDRAHDLFRPLPPRERLGVIIFGSDQGLCGSFNEQILDFAQQRLSDSPLGPRGPLTLVFGHRVANRIQDLDQPIYGVFELPSTPSGIALTVGRALVTLDELRVEEALDRVVVFHHRPRSDSTYKPHELQVIPLDPRWLRALAQRPWPTRMLPIFMGDRERLFSAFVRQYLFLAMFRACAESVAAENTARLAAMQAAEKNIEERLTELRTRYHRQRQEAITEELFEIVAGFEELGSVDKDQSR